MVNVIRTSCTYSDEYILDKPIRWVRNTYELCLRQSYDNNLQLAHMVIHLYASGMSEKVDPPKSFGQMMKSIKDKRNKDEDNWMADEDTLAGLGLKVKSSIVPTKKSSEKDNDSHLSPEEEATQSETQAN